VQCPCGLNLARLLCEPEVALRFPLASLRGWSAGGKGVASSVVAKTVIELCCEKAGMVHAIAAWFQLPMTSRANASVVDTGPFAAPDNMRSNHWRQICFLLDDPFCVNAHDVVNIEVLLDISSGLWCRVI
jgi:hypothetical protein